MKKYRFVLEALVLTAIICFAAFGFDSSRLTMYSPPVMLVSLAVTHLVYVFIVNPIRKNLATDGLELGLEVDGHRLYRFKSLDHAPKFREMIIRLAHFQLDLGVKVSDLEEAYKLGIEFCNKGDSSKAGQIFSMLQMQSSAYAHSAVLFQIASGGILVDGEPLHDISPKHVLLKEQLVKSNPEVRAFFLSTTHIYLTNLGAKLSTTEYQELLMNPERVKRERLFSQLISANTSRDLNSHVTTKFYGWQSDLASLMRKLYLKNPQEATTKS